MRASSEPKTESTLKFEGTFEDMTAISTTGAGVKKAEKKKS